MEYILGSIALYVIGKLLLGKSHKADPRTEREKQTFFKYPKGGYGLDDDPVMDELMFIDIMEDDL